MGWWDARCQIQTDNYYSVEELVKNCRTLLQREVETHGLAQELIDLVRWVTAENDAYVPVERALFLSEADGYPERGVAIVLLAGLLAAILKAAKTEQHKNRLQYGGLYHLNYYTEVKEKDRTYYEVYSLPRTDEIPEGYKEISFVCLRPDGAYESPSTVGIMCRTASRKVEGLEGFHFHQLRHTFTSNLLSNGAAPKDVQELLGHADVSTTMNIYAHAIREAKRTSARLLDKVVGGE